MFLHLNFSEEMLSYLYIILNELWGWNYFTLSESPPFLLLGFPSETRLRTCMKMKISNDQVSPPETGVPGTYSGASSGQVTQRKPHGPHEPYLKLLHTLFLHACAQTQICPHSDVLLNLTVAAILSRVHTSTVLCSCTIFSCLPVAEQVTVVCTN